MTSNNILDSENLALAMEVDTTATNINQEYYGSIIYKDKDRCRGCYNNLNGNDPASRYQKLKLIQNTVRVPSSIYTMNLGALNVYEKPSVSYQPIYVDGSIYIASPGVNWNQMSDRSNPHIQKVISGSGSTYGGNSLKRTLTRLRPGALSPGGSGVDIKHNSYDRYLARIKGKAPLRRGPIPKAFASPYIPFNRAYPVYGGKLLKTSIVNDCNCPIISGQPQENALDSPLYKNNELGEFNTSYKFSVGDTVLAPYIVDGKVIKTAKATIIAINNDILTVQFVDNQMIQQVPISLVYIFLYNRCVPNICYNGLTPQTYQSGYYVNNTYITACLITDYFPNYIPGVASSLPTIPQQLVIV
jgi:hypothetical protein